MVPSQGRLVVGVPPILRPSGLIKPSSTHSNSRVNANAPNPRIEIRKIDAKLGTKFDLDTNTGIIVYGRSKLNGRHAPILIIKMKLVTKQVYTEIPVAARSLIPSYAPSDPLRDIRRSSRTTIADPTGESISEPALIDLSQFDDNSGDIILPPWCDAIILNVGGDFAFGGGTGGGLQIIRILKGKEKGLYIYRPSTINANIGFMLSAGASLGIIDYNERNNQGKLLNPNLFSGSSQGWSADAGLLGASVITSYADGKRHFFDSWRLKEDDIAYQIYMGSSFFMGASLGAGFQYSFSKSDLWLSFPIGGN